MTQAEIATLAHEIAEQTARDDLRGYCRFYFTDNDQVPWYDVGMDLVEGTDRELKRAIAYLEARGLLEHHPERPELVRLKEQP